MQTQTYESHKIWIIHSNIRDLFVSGKVSKHMLWRLVHKTKQQKYYVLPWLVTDNLVRHMDKSQTYFQNK